MFRVGGIFKKTQIYEWRYICSKENVADDATMFRNVEILMLEKTIAHCLLCVHVLLHIETAR